MRWGISDYLTPPDPITSLDFPGGSMSLTLWRDCAFGAESNGQGWVWGEGLPSVCSLSGESLAWRNTLHL